MRRILHNSRMGLVRSGESASLSSLPSLSRGRTIEDRLPIWALSIL